MIRKKSGLAPLPARRSFSEGGKRDPKGREGGFTLIELLVAVALMVILLAAVTMIFAGTTDTVAIQEARTTVFTNARYAFDILENDCLGMLSFEPMVAQPPGPSPLPPPPPASGASLPLQRFWMENYYGGTPGAMPTKMGGHHTDQAADTISFRTTSTVGNEMLTCEVTYTLIPGNMAVGPNNTLVAGDDSHKQTLRTGRPLFTLLRKVRLPEDPAAPPSPTPLDPKQPWKYNAQIKDPVTNALTQVMDQELCHYVTSFNIEYYANNMQFSQIDPSPFPETNPAGQESTSGGAASSTLYRCPAIRVTLSVVDDIGERQERTFQKEIWLPQG